MLWLQNYTRDVKVLSILKSLVDPSFQDLGVHLSLLIVVNDNPLRFRALCFASGSHVDWVAHFCVIISHGRIQKIVLPRKWILAHALGHSVFNRMMAPGVSWMSLSLNFSSELLGSNRNVQNSFKWRWLLASCNFWKVKRTKA